MPLTQRPGNWRITPEFNVVMLKLMTSKTPEPYCVCCLKKIMVLLNLEKAVKFIFTEIVSQEKGLTHYPLAIKFAILRKKTISARKPVLFIHNQAPTPRN